jgi:hypothetical protein
MRRKNSQPLPYAERLSIAATASLVTAVAEAADRTMTSMNAYCRGAILEALERDGVEVGEEVQHRAG